MVFTIKLEELDAAEHDEIRKNSQDLIHTGAIPKFIYVRLCAFDTNDHKSFVSLCARFFSFPKFEDTNLHKSAQRHKHSSTNFFFHGCIK